VKSSGTGSGSGSSDCLRSVMNWLERVLTALDCYSWTFGQNLLSPSQLLIGQLISHDVLTCRCIGGSGTDPVLLQCSSCCSCRCWGDADQKKPKSFWIGSG